MYQKQNEIDSHVAAPGAAVSSAAPGFTTVFAIVSREAAAEAVASGVAAFVLISF